MRSPVGEVLAVIAVPLIVVAMLQPEQALAVIVLSITAVALARSVAVRVPGAASGIGGRAARHRHVLDAAPAPRHPRTPGRRRSRAPSVSTAVA